MRGHVYRLARGIGERNLRNPDSLERARDYIARQLEESGLEVALQEFTHRGVEFHNVEAVLKGTAAQALVVGAHYDSVEGSPGANDNASGVAVLLELARTLNGRSFETDIRFVAFANEEPPYFNSGEGMGSVEYVRSLENPAEMVRGMISIETVGFYSDDPGSQHYPPLIGSLYPDRGNFIAFVGNLDSRSFVGEVADAFRKVATLPSEEAALPSSIPGVGWSDHRSFWEVGVPALMVTDTAPFRDPHYHLSSDTPDRLDYERMARLVRGLEHVVIALAGSREEPSRPE